MTRLALAIAGSIAITGLWWGGAIMGDVGIMWAALFLAAPVAIGVIVL